MVASCVYKFRIVFLLLWPFVFSNTQIRSLFAAGLGAAKNIELISLTKNVLLAALARSVCHPCRRLRNCILYLQNCKAACIVSGTFVIKFFQNSDAERKNMG